MTPSDVIRSARFEVRMHCASNPRLQAFYPSVVWWGHRKIRRSNGEGDRKETWEASVLPDTELVIDGFQGSANSYFVRAFRYAQPRPVRLAHHLHAAAAVRKAVRMGIPTLVTLREPVGAALSLTSRWPYVSLAQALRHHALYYGAIEPVADGLVVSPFAATTRRTDLVIEAINDRFGTDFVPRYMTEADVQAVRPQAAEMTPERQAMQAARAEAKARKREELSRPEAQRWLREAEAIYRRLLARSPTALTELEGR